MSTTTSTSSTKKGSDSSGIPQARRHSPQLTHRGQGSLGTSPRTTQSEESSNPYLPKNPKPSEPPVPMSPEPTSEAADDDGTDVMFEIVKQRNLTEDDKLDACLRINQEAKDRKAVNEAHTRIFGKEETDTPTKTRSRSPSVRATESDSMVITGSQPQSSTRQQRSTRAPRSLSPRFSTDDGQPNLTEARHRARSGSRKTNVTDAPPADI